MEPPVTNSSLNIIIMLYIESSDHSTITAARAVLGNKPPMLIKLQQNHPSTNEHRRRNVRGELEDPKIESRYSDNTCGRFASGRASGARIAIARAGETSGGGSTGDSSSAC